MDFELDENGQKPYCINEDVEKFTLLFFKGKLTSFIDNQGYLLLAATDSYKSLFDLIVTSLYFLKDALGGIEVDKWI